MTLTVIAMYCSPILEQHTLRRPCNCTVTRELTQYKVSWNLAYGTAWCGRYTVTVDIGRFESDIGRHIKMY